MATGRFRYMGQFASMILGQGDELKIPYTPDVLESMQNSGWNGQ